MWLEKNNALWVTAAFDNAAYWSTMPCKSAVKTIDTCFSGSSMYRPLAYGELLPSTKQRPPFYQRKGENGGTEESSFGKTFFFFLLWNTIATFKVYHRWVNHHDVAFDGCSQVRKRWGSWQVVRCPQKRIQRWSSVSSPLSHSRSLLAWVGDMVAGKWSLHRFEQQSIVTVACGHIYRKRLYIRPAKKKKKKSTTTPFHKTCWWKSAQQTISKADVQIIRAGRLVGQVNNYVASKRRAC